ncbi:MFS transporter, partial [Chloroflexota bacterium]
NILTLYLIFGILISMGYNAGFGRPSLAAAAKWFIKKRGLAFSFVASGAGIGAVILLPVLAWLIIEFGWRTTSILAGSSMLIFGLPAVYFLRSTPEEMGLRPDGGTVAVATEATIDDSSEELNLTVRESLKTSAFWVYNIGMVCRGAILSSIVVHQIPRLVDIGIGYQTAAGVLGQMVFVSIVGRLVFGWLSDRFDKRRILFACFLLQAIGMWIFINAYTTGMLYLYVVVYGLGYGGAIPLTHALRADLFGRKTFATIFGITTLITILPTVAAPVFIGYLFDVTQSYSASFYALIIVSLIGGFTFLAIRKPKPPTRLRQIQAGN